MTNRTEGRRLHRALVLTADLAYVCSVHASPTDGMRFTVVVQ
ncbi:MAG TPA: hypothetical protein VHR41_11795 [Gemmatimonadales bacterium]|jgi:hypothetical protein|nr:hypothetical protein [Gemmatimonadales bacterium]